MCVLQVAAGRCLKPENEVVRLPERMASDFPGMVRSTSTSTSCTARARAPTCSTPHVDGMTMACVQVQDLDLGPPRDKSFEEEMAEAAHELALMPDVDPWNCRLEPTIKD